MRPLAELDLELQAVGHIVLDQEGGLADRRPLGIGEGAHVPGAGRRRGDDRHAQAAPAEALVGNGDAAVLDAVRPLDHQRQRHAGRGDALARRAGAR